MKQFQSIEKIDTGILYTLELTSSLSVLLLAFGLIASMANVLTKGSILTSNSLMQELYAWTQCIAIDASIPGVILRTFSYKNDKVKFWLYVGLSILLLFTAMIVSNIESVQQTLNLTLDASYLHVFVPVEGLIWIRSISIVLLIVCHAIRHVNIQTPTSTSKTSPTVIVEPQNTHVEEAQIRVSEDDVKALPAPKRGRRTGNLEKVKEYLADHPKAKVKDVASALHISLPTASRYVKLVSNDSLIQ